MTKTYKQPEQDLIDDFVATLKISTDSDISKKSGTFINTKCRGRGNDEYADVEYISDSGTHWVIEAKTNKTNNFPNEIHKVFGNLLKETGRDNREKSKYAILIPEDAEGDFRNGFMKIDHQKYIEFGKLIPINSVFLYGNSGITKKTWSELYDETVYLLNSPENKAHLLSAITNVENNQLIDVDINKL